MKIKSFLNFAFTALLILGVSVSCRNDDNTDILPPDPGLLYENGFLISNEGNFGTPTASVDFIPNDFSEPVFDIYSKANNGESLGDVLQNIYLKDNAAFLVLNNSNKIVVVNRYTFNKIGEITDHINLPRYATSTDNYLYVSNSGNPASISVYNLQDLSFVKEIPVNTTAEYIVNASDKIFVQNASFGFGNSLSLIDPSSQSVTSSIDLPKGQLQKIVSDGTQVYALASDDSADSYIYKITPSGNISETIDLIGISGARNLELDSGKFYFTAGLDVYQMDATSNNIPASPIFTAAESAPYSGLYGFSVIDGKIFTADASGFTADSEVTVYNTSGDILKTFKAGRGTNSFYKN